MFCGVRSPGLQGRIDGWKVRRGVAGRCLLAPVFLPCPPRMQGHWLSLPLPWDTAMGATGPGCASRQASSSTKRKAALRLRLRWIGKTESSKLQAIRGWQQSRGNGRSWFGGRRDQDAATFCRDPQDFRIESAIWDCARSREEVDRRLSPEQSFPNVGIDVGVSLKADLQASLGSDSFLARSKRSIIS
jgi:hypothetical protein